MEPMTFRPDADALRSRVAVVAGATRGAGRGIAMALGEAGATVICTGRSSRTRALRSDYDRPETPSFHASYFLPRAAGFDGSLRNAAGGFTPSSSA
jgi:NAD(P)-dependent dehydrogenase (short-subunit alcohol dehydrogenase family)